MKDIFDNKVTDLKEKSTEAPSQIADELDIKVQEIEDSIDSHTVRWEYRRNPALIRQRF